MTELVPIVDISGWVSVADDAADRRSAIAAEVDEACRRIGFLQITGHGIPADVIDAMLAAADAFFALPVEVKGTFRSTPEENRGYAPMGSESLTYSLGVESLPDLFEAFNVGPDAVDELDPAVAAERHRIFAPNRWPADDQVAGMRSAFVAYFDAVNALARRLTSIFAVALDLPADFFDDKLTHSTETLRVNHFVRQPDSPDPLPGQVRMGAHTDYGIVTVLYGDQVPGLEIVGPDGGWHGVMPEAGAFLVNLGDLLARWTNDRWRSTVHRVAPPPRDDERPNRRRSAAFFLDGNWDAPVEVLATCCSEDNPSRYPPTTAGEHLMAKLISSRSRTSDAREGMVDPIGDRISAVTGEAPSP